MGRRKPAAGADSAKTLAFARGIALAKLHCAKLNAERRIEGNEADPGPLMSD
jgi:hypothetical protein